MHTSSRGSHDNKHYYEYKLYSRFHIIRVKPKVLIGQKDFEVKMVDILIEDLTTLPSMSCIFEGAT